jgi:hypothetical protein
MLLSIHRAMIFELGGKRSAKTLRWAFNLKTVSRHPAYESHRWSYLIDNGLVGWGEGLI